MEITIGHYLGVAAILFTLGVFGIFLNRKNVIVILMSIELMFNAVNLTLVALAKYVAPAALQEDIASVLTGQVFAVFIIAVAAAEAAVGLGILLAFYRNKETVNIDEMSVMRW